MKKPWYEKLFENYALQYEKESFVQGTKGECDFIEEELNYNRSLTILDVGCGTGRHTIELTKRGYTVTGIDLSESQLALARTKATEHDLQIPFYQHDARNLPFSAQFDVAIMLCEGGFPLMETDEMNYQILQSVSNSLKKQAIFLFTTLNGLYPLFHSIDSFHEKEIKKEGAIYKSQGFNVMTMRDYNVTTFTDDSGNTHDIACDERYYIPSEITWLLRSLQFTSIEIFGAHIGSYSRKHPLTTDDFEMLVVARRE